MGVLVGFVCQPAQAPGCSGNLVKHYPEHFVGKLLGEINI